MSLWNSIKRLNIILSQDQDLKQLVKLYTGRKVPTMKGLIELFYDSLMHPEARRYLIHALSIVARERYHVYKGNIDEIIIKRPSFLILSLER